MKIVLKLLIFTFITNLCHSCHKVNEVRETVMDNVVHIEDSIHVSVPIYSSLCDDFSGSKKYLNIGTAKLYSEIVGEGVPIVLINGGPGSTHHFFHPWFERLKKNHKIIYYDQRGTGLSSFEKDTGYTFKQAVDDLEKLRIKLDIEKWIVCGFSYGGGLAQFYALKYPQNVLGMALIGALPLMPNADFNSLQEKYISDQEKQMKKKILTAYIDKRINFQAFLYNLSLNGDWKRQNYYKPTSQEMARAALYEWVNDKGFNSTMSKSYSKYNFEGVFKKCPIPTIIFEGNQDLTWGAAKAKIFSNNHPNALFIKYENAAHNVFADVPEKFFNDLLEFTSNLQPVSSEKIQKWKKTLSWDSIIVTE